MIKKLNFLFQASLVIFCLQGCIQKKNLCEFYSLHQYIILNFADSSFEVRNRGHFPASIYSGKFQVINDSIFYYNIKSLISFANDTMVFPTGDTTYLDLSKYIIKDIKEVYTNDSLVFFNEVYYKSLKHFKE